jgi:hypothetical protein
MAVTAAGVSWACAVSPANKGFGPLVNAFRVSFTADFSS